MAEDQGHEHDERERARRVETTTEQSGAGHEGLMGQPEAPSYPVSLLADFRLNGRGNQPVQAAVLQRMQQTYGNRATQRFVQRNKSAASHGKEDNLGAQIQAKAGGGSALAPDVQVQLEGGLGADLSGVRVHTDGDADSMARSVDAVAFTTGNDIFFSQGTYNPGTSDGMKLLAHEATHTVQQSQGPVSGTPTAGGVSVSHPSDSYEQAAERSADAVVSRQAVQRSAASSAPLAVQREDDEELKKDDEEQSVQTMRASGGATTVQRMATTPLSVQRDESPEAPVEEQEKEPEEPQVVQAMRASGAPVPVQRDDPPTATNPPPATTTDTPTSGSSSSSTNQAADPNAPKTHETKWFIDYSEIPMSGRGAKPKQRSDKTALYVDKFTVFPDKATGAAGTLKGVNAAASGKVYLGSVTHPEEAGKVSGVVRFGGKPGKSVDLQFTETTDPKVKGKFGPEKSKLKTKIQSALDAELTSLEQNQSSLVMMEASLQQKAQSLLPPSDDKHGYEIKVAVTENVPAGAEGKALPLDEVRYAKIDADSFFDTKVNVPVEKQEGTWSTKEEGKAGEKVEKKEEQSNSSTIKTTISQEEKTKIITSLKSAVNTTLKDAWKKEKETGDSTKDNWEFSSKQTVGGELAGKVELDPKSLSKVLGPWISKIPKVGKIATALLALGKGEITGKVTTSFEAAEKVAGETAHSERKTELQSHDTEVTTAIETLSSTESEKALSTAVENTFTVTGSSGTTNTQESGKTKTIEGSGKTITYNTGKPTLEVGKQ